MGRGELYLREDLRRAWGGRDPFREVRRLDGEVYRALENRRTLRFHLGGRSYFAKRHHGVPWREILKNLVRLRLPVVSARNEWRAIKALRALEIDTLCVAAYGRRGWRPADIESFLVTDDLGEVESLEDVCADWVTASPALDYKRTLIDTIADIAGRMHRNGICHRDFYICHFLRRRNPPHRLYLIDLHRALVKHRLGRRWKVKDLGALYFSAMDIGLTRRDLYRFMRAYSGKPLRRTLRDDRRFWRAVERRARRFRQREERHAARGAGGEGGARQAR